MRRAIIDREKVASRIVEVLQGQPVERFGSDENRRESDSCEDFTTSTILLKTTTAAQAIIVLRSALFLNPRKAFRREAKLQVHRSLPWTASQLDLGAVRR